MIHWIVNFPAGKTREGRTRHEGFAREMARHAARSETTRRGFLGHGVG
ncbi:MAG TPA: hypothetical protein PKM88_13870 [bacterium]|nr:hypothetical protein [bacterium]